MQQTNGLAITSLVSSVLAWLMALLLACFNFIILPLLTVATMGVGGVLYICTGAIGLISPIGWLVAVITGNSAIKQIKQTGANGEGIAKAGMISGYVGLGITLLILCGFGVTFILSTASYYSY
jgi:hypothetical protein